MQLFGLEGSGFVISLGITLLLCGAIMFYTLKRFSYIEASIIQNAKILQSFITKLENDNSGANQIAIQSANLQSKIDVSDNDSSDYDSNSEGQSESESENEELSESEDDIDKEENNNKSEDFNKEENNLDIKFISIEEINNTNDNIEELEVNLLNENDNDKNSSSVCSLSSDCNDKENQTEIFSQKENKKENDNILTFKNTNLNKKKVSELKKLLLNHSSDYSESDVNKLKKDELIKILQE